MPRPRVHAEYVAEHGGHRLPIRLEAVRSDPADAVRRFRQRVLTEGFVHVKCDHVLAEPYESVRVHLDRQGAELAKVDRPIAL